MQLLEEAGLGGFNTNAVAKAAGVNIGTLYHYFPDKTALLAEMFVRSESRRVEYFSSRVADLEFAHDLREWVNDTVGALMKMRSATPGATALRNAIRVVPELLDLGVQQDARSASALAVAIRTRYPHVTKARAEAVSQLIMDSGVAALDRVGAGAGNARTVQRELTEMVTAYLSSLE